MRSPGHSRWRGRVMPANWDARVEARRACSLGRVWWRDGATARSPGRGGAHEADRAEQWRVGNQEQLIEPHYTRRHRRRRLL